MAESNDPTDLAAAGEEAKAETPRTLDSQALDAEAGQVAIADRNLRALHEKAVDGGQQAAEQGGRGREGDGGSLGHCCPLFCVAEQFRFVVWGQSMYTRCQSQQTCLHSSN